MKNTNKQRGWFVVPSVYGIKGKIEVSNREPSKNYS